MLSGFKYPSLVADTSQCKTFSAVSHDTLG